MPPEWLLLSVLAQHYFAPVTHPGSPYRPAAVERREIPRLVPGWPQRRVVLCEKWREVLGQWEPQGSARRWIGDLRQARLGQCEPRVTYERCELEIPLESDFSQRYLLLRPLKKGRYPAVIAWTSTTPDYREPEKWWGRWLAERGFVVLCGWSFLRHYRDGTTYSTGALERLEERFGPWRGLGKMTWDIGQERKYLAARPDVDPRRIGFIGFSLGAKAALYAAAFTPGLAAVVAVDPGIPLNGPTNWFARWYLDWDRTLPLLNSDPATPELERDHHEILALAAPRPLLILGGDAGRDSDGESSRPYVERAREVYASYGAADRLRFVVTGEGHRAVGPRSDAEWQAFFLRWLR